MDKTKVPDKVRCLIYILAPSHSGSTLLTFLLSMHKSIATIGELKESMHEVDTYHCSCGFLMRECNFWKGVIEEMRKVDTSFALDSFGTHFRADSFLYDRLFHAGIRNKFMEITRNSMLRLLPGCRRLLYNILERNRQFIDVVCHLQQGEMFLDGSKEAVRLKLLNSANYWNLKVLYLIRDGRGVTNSYIRKGMPMETAAKEWYRTHRECDRVVREFGKGKYITVHYEDLCRNPKKTMAKIYDFLGLDADLGDLRFRSCEHHILGNRMRLGSTEEIRLDEKWKSALTNRELGVFERTAGRLNRLYGYD